MLGKKWTMAGVALLLTVAGARPTPGQAPVPVKVTVTVEGRTQTLRGMGRCGHEPHASIYGAPAALWLVEYVDSREGTGVSLSYWRFAAAGEEPQFSLAVDSKGAAHRISTVKGGKLEGSGRATFRPTAVGGRFEITGKTQDAKPLEATIECASFSGIHAEGG